MLNSLNENSAKNTENAIFVEKRQLELMHGEGMLFLNICSKIYGCHKGITDIKFKLGNYNPTLVAFQVSHINPQMLP